MSAGDRADHVSQCSVGQPESQGNKHNTGGQAAAENPVAQNERRGPGPEEDQDESAKKLGRILSRHVHPRLIRIPKPRTVTCPLSVR